MVSFRALDLQNVQDIYQIQYKYYIFQLTLESYCCGSQGEEGVVYEFYGRPAWSIKRVSSTCLLMYTQTMDIKFKLNLWFVFRACKRFLELLQTVKELPPDLVDTMQHLRVPVPPQSDGHSCGWRVVANARMLVRYLYRNENNNMQVKNKYQN